MSKLYTCEPDSTFAKLPSDSSYLRADGSKRFAVVTMLIIDDGYLPSLVMLAQSLVNVDPELRKKIDLVCIVTPDIPAYTRNDIKVFFDHVTEMPYLEVRPDQLRHRSEVARQVYSKTFTKIQAWLLVQYDKIVFCDADMIVLRREFYNLFTLNGPAGVYFGCYRPFHDDHQYNEYMSKTKKTVSHGAMIPKSMFNWRCLAAAANSKVLYVGVESSIMVLKPDATDYDDLIEDMRRMPSNRYSGDSLFISKHFEGRWRHIDIRFLGRWMNPDEHPELIVLDLYGTEGKPWQINKFAATKVYPDIQYWWRRFIEFYPSFKDSIKDAAVHRLYTALKSAESPMLPSSTSSPNA